MVQDHIVLQGRTVLQCRTTSPSITTKQLRHRGRNSLDILRKMIQRPLAISWKPNRTSSMDKALGRRLNESNSCFPPRRFRRIRHWNLKLENENAYCTNLNTRMLYTHLYGISSNSCFPLLRCTSSHHIMSQITKPSCEPSTNQALESVTNLGEKCLAYIKRHQVLICREHCYSVRNLSYHLKQYHKFSKTESSPGDGFLTQNGHG